MINNKMEQAFNDQIQKEFYSSYLYLAMSVYADSQNMKGIAHWLKVQHAEEKEHAEKLVSYLLERGGKVAFQALPAPAAEYGSLIEMFEAVKEHEEYITKSINELYEAAGAEKDYAAQIFLQWFIEEQVEEEGNASEILEKLKMVGERSGAILYLDKELKKRVAE